MIGRVCNIGKKINPIVVDCSENAESFVKLLMNAGVTAPTESVPGVGGTNKPVVNIRIGSEEKYDINKLFKLLGMVNEEELTKTAQNIRDEYVLRGGRLYKTFEELKHNADYSIFNCLCWKYDMPVKTAFDKIASLAA